MRLPPIAFEDYFYARKQLSLLQQSTNTMKTNNIDHFHYTLQRRPCTDDYAFHDNLTNFDRAVVCGKFVRQILGLPPTLLTPIPKWITFQISRSYHKGWKKARHVKSHEGIFYICKAETHLGTFDTYKEVLHALIALDVKPGGSFYYKISKA